MKSPIAGLLCAAFLLMICICGCMQLPGSQSQESRGRITGLTWYLFSFHESGSPESIVSGTTITAFFNPNGTVSGSAGCYQYTAPYTGTPENLVIGQPVSTGMNCGSPEGIMTQETRYLSTIPLASEYSVRNNTLELRGKQGDVILTYTAIHPDLVTTWRLISYTTAAGQTWTPGTLTTITLRFFNDGTISGNSGCNDYRGTFRITGENSLAMGITGMTKMICGIGGVMELETEYTTLLPEMTHYSISGGKLLLSDTTGNNRMLFEESPV